VITRGRDPYLSNKGKNPAPPQESREGKRFMEKEAGAGEKREIRPRKRVFEAWRPKKVRDAWVGKRASA